MGECNKGRDMFGHPSSSPIWRKARLPPRYAPSCLWTHNSQPTCAPSNRYRLCSQTGRSKMLNNTNTGVLIGWQGGTAAIPPVTVKSAHYCNDEGTTVVASIHRPCRMFSSSSKWLTAQTMSLSSDSPTRNIKLIEGLQGARRSDARATPMQKVLRSCPTGRRPNGVARHHLDRLDLRYHTGIKLEILAACKSPTMLSPR